METGGARRTLCDAPNVGDDFPHIIESGLQFCVVGIRAVALGIELLRDEKFCSISGIKVRKFWERDEICELFLLVARVALRGSFM